MEAVSAGQAYDTHLESCRRYVAAAWEERWDEDLTDEVAAKLAALANIIADLLIVNVGVFASQVTGHGWPHPDWHEVFTSTLAVATWAVGLGGSAVESPPSVLSQEEEAQEVIEAWRGQAYMSELLVAVAEEEQG